MNLLLPTFKGEGPKFTAYSTRGKANGSRLSYSFYPRSLTFYHISISGFTNRVLSQCLPSHPAKSLLRFPGTSLKPFTLSLVSSAGIESNVLLELWVPLLPNPFFPKGFSLVAKKWSKESTSSNVGNCLIKRWGFTGVSTFLLMQGSDIGQISPGLAIEHGVSRESYIYIYLYNDMERDCQVEKDHSIPLSQQENGCANGFRASARSVRCLLWSTYFIPWPDHIALAEW